jgi:hypothetical protein
MDGAAQTAGGLRIAWRLFQLHGFFVQLLHEFGSGFEEQLAEFGHALVVCAIVGLIAAPIAAPILGRDGHIFTSTR